MVYQEGRRSQRHLSLFVSSVAIAVTLGLAGCQGAGHDVKLNDDLVRRTDKFFDVAHVSGSTFVMVGYDGRILRSEDNGNSWKEIERPTNFSLTQVSFVGEAGWAVGHQGTVINTKALFSVSFVDQNHGWACGDESTWLWTNNGGETWNAERMEVSQVGLSTETTLAVPDIIYYGVQFLDQQNGWIIGEFGNIRHTSDGGKTWDSQHESLLDQMVAKGGNKDVMALGAFFRVRFSDPQNGILVGAAGAIATTNDGGAKWQWVSREGDKPDVPPLHLYNAVLPGQNGHVVATGANGMVLLSENKGVDWKPATIPGGVFTWINGIAFSPEGKGVLVGGKGLILLTDDAGQTWRTFEEKKSPANAAHS
jgi:photosystem II stability/assembly factor-like uncharacterized protein